MKQKSKIGPDGRAEWFPGTAPKPEVLWQIPAVGDSKLTPDEAHELADYLDSRDDDRWLQFMLLGDRPANVASDLRAAVDRAENEAQRKRDMAA